MRKRVEISKDRKIEICNNIIQMLESRIEKTPDMNERIMYPVYLCHKINTSVEESMNASRIERRFPEFYKLKRELNLRSRESSKFGCGGWWLKHDYESRLVFMKKLLKMVEDDK